MKLDREDLENACERDVRRFAAYLHKKGVPDLQEWATMKLKWLIDSLVFAGYVRYPELEKSMYGGHY